MKLSIPLIKQFIKESPQDSPLYVFSIYYYGNCSFDRLVFPTTVIPTLDNNKLSFFKLSSSGKTLKTKIPYTGHKTHTVLHVFDSEEECFNAFKKEYNHLKSIIIEDQTNFSELIKELESF